MDLAKQIIFKNKLAMTSELHANFIIDKTTNIDKYVECEVAKGGICALVAKNNPNTQIYALDAWEGMPEISDKDESYLKKYVGVKDIYGDEKEVINTFNKIDAPLNNLHIIKGWIENTIPLNKKKLENIDFLRIDVDWYDAILYALENLYFNIKKGGIILLDDGAYKGCRIAVDTFRKKYSIDNVIYSGEKYGCQSNHQFWWIV